MKELLNPKGRLVKVTDARVEYFLKKGFTHPVAKPKVEPKPKTKK